MGRPFGPEKIRLNLDLDRETRELMDRVKRESKSVTLNETVRRAIGLYWTVLDAQKQGRSIVVRAEGRPDESIIIV